MKKLILWLMLMAGSVFAEEITVRPSFLADPRFDFNSEDTHTAMVHGQRFDFYVTFKNILPSIPGVNDIRFWVEGGPPDDAARILEFTVPDYYDSTNTIRTQGWYLFPAVFNDLDFGEGPHRMGVEALENGVRYMHAVWALVVTGFDPPSDDPPPDDPPPDDGPSDPPVDEDPHDNHFHTQQRLSAWLQIVINRAIDEFLAEPGHESIQPEHVTGALQATIMRRQFEEDLGYEYDYENLPGALE